jgi:hypothetical protein
MIIDISPSFDNDHPANVDLFSDWYSLIHVLMGWISGVLPEPYSLGAMAFYAGYQVSQAGSGEPWSRTGGELIEYGIGLMIAGSRRLK